VLNPGFVWRRINVIVDIILLTSIENSCEMGFHTFSKSALATTGLREILDERLEAIQAQVRGTIAGEMLMVRGLDKPAELAKDMLTNSIKMI
jgi:hypothetical protein